MVRITSLIAAAVICTERFHSAETVIVRKQERQGHVFNAQKVCTPQPVRK